MNIITRKVESNLKPNQVDLIIHNNCEEFMHCDNAWNVTECTTRLVNGLISYNKFYYLIEDYLDNQVPTTILIHDIFNCIKFTDKGGYRFVDFINLINNGAYGKTNFIITGLGYDYLDFNSDKSLGRYTSTQVFKKLNHTYAEVISLDDYSVKVFTSSKNMYTYLSYVENEKFLDEIRYYMLTQGENVAKDLIDNPDNLPAILMYASDLNINPNMLAECIYNSLYNKDCQELSYDLLNLTFNLDNLNEDLEASEVMRVANSLTDEEDKKKFHVICHKVSLSIKDVEYLTKLGYNFSDAYYSILLDKVDKGRLENLLDKSELSDYNLKNSTISPKSNFSLTARVVKKRKDLKSFTKKIINDKVVGFAGSYIYSKLAIPDFETYKLVNPGESYKGIAAEFNDFLLPAKEAFLLYVENYKPKDVSIKYKLGPQDDGTYLVHTENKYHLVEQITRKDGSLIQLKEAFWDGSLKTSTIVKEMYKHLEDIDECLIDLT